MPEKGKSQLYKIILLGDGGVGKSCLMNRFVSNKFDAQSFHTIGVEFLNRDITIKGKTVTLQIWDTAGQERFKSLRTPFYRGADCCLLTFALDDATSFRNLSMWKTEFLYYANIDDAANFPFVILGNKSDLEEHHLTKEEIQTWCDSFRYPYFKTSAKTAVNVDAAFEAAVEKILQFDQSSRSVPSGGDTVNLSRVQSQGSSASACC